LDSRTADGATPTCQLGHALKRAEGLAVQLRKAFGLWFPWATPSSDAECHSKVAVQRVLLHATGGETTYETLLDEHEQNNDRHDRNDRNTEYVVPAGFILADKLRQRY